MTEDQLLQGHDLAVLTDGIAVVTSKDDDDIGKLARLFQHLLDPCKLVVHRPDRDRTQRSGTRNRDRFFLMGSEWPITGTSTNTCHSSRTLICCVRYIGTRLTAPVVQRLRDMTPKL